MILKHHNKIGAIVGLVGISPVHALHACDLSHETPTSILAFESELPSEGIGYYLDEFRIRDFDMDGDNDIGVLIRDEAYNGLPNYSLNYYRNDTNGFCKYIVFSGETALNTNTSLNVGSDAKTLPQFTFEFVSANPVTFEMENVVDTYSFSELANDFQKTAR